MLAELAGIKEYNNVLSKTLENLIRDESFAKTF